MTEPVLMFRDELAASFGSLDWLPIPDGQIHRFHVPGDRTGSRNGWYVLYLDGIAAGAFGSWKAGASWSTWNSREPADHREAEQLRQRIEQSRRQREAERQRQQQAAAERAGCLWSDSRRAAEDHPYLIAKGVQAHGLRQRGGELLVPLIHAGRVVNLQRIALDGSKRFLFGGRVAGCYSPIGHIEAGGLLYVCEGWATGATIHEETGDAVACAMNAGNLREVGEHLQDAYPDSPLIVAGDDDRQTEGNPGRNAAAWAAGDLGAYRLIFPVWPEGAPLELTDFNDLRQWLRSKQ